MQIKEMVYLPVELQLKIADCIKCRWDRHDFVQSVGIDHIYYGTKNVRPFDRKFLSFVPRKYLPMLITYDDIDDDSDDEEEQVNSIVTLPIGDGSRQYVMYLDTFDDWEGNRQTHIYYEKQDMYYNYEDKCWKYFGKPEHKEYYHP